VWTIAADCCFRPQPPMSVQRRRQHRTVLFNPIHIPQAASGATPTIPYMIGGVHVLHVISSLDPRAGGTTAALVALAHAQMDAGLTVIIASTFAGDFRTDAVDRLRALGIKVHLVGPNRKLLAYHPGIKAMLAPLIESADIVHVHALWEEIQHQAAKLARRFHKPYLFTPHGMLDPWSLSQSRLKKRIYLALRLRPDLSRASGLHFADELERDLAAGAALPTPTLVEKHVVDLSEFQTLPPRNQFRDRYPQLGDRPIVLFLSRLHAKKGLDLLIPAFARLRSTNASLVLAGPAGEAYQLHLTELAREHGVLNRVLFTGMLYGLDRVAAMVDADVFVLPSHQENFGIVVIEALAAGTPVVISDQVNIHRQITEANVGQVVPMDVDAIAEAIDRYLADNALRAQTAERARPFVWKKYDRREIARHWCEHYERLKAQYLR
jgi:glycosyltransferase involved in cell wall biosynthesis